MPKYYNKEIDGEAYINKFLEKAMNKLMDNLKEKLDYNFSPSTELEISIMLDTFVRDVSNVIKTKDLKEPETFKNNNIPDIFN